ncbi:MAG: hypothetical protein JW953_16325 [Anaerolineae bacterium]|nr:hypothetical protein [Anaerolineae bacterium]
MHIPGHIAVALVEHRFLVLQGQDEQVMLKPLLIASVFPDLVDKAIGYVFHLMPNGRHYAHNIFSVIGLSLAVALVWGKTVGLAWFVGHLGHLLADDIRRVPWLFPVRPYHFYQGRLKLKPIRFLKETIFLAVVLFIYHYSR